MPRLSELIRRPSIALDFSQLVSRTPYFFESTQLAAIPQLETYQRKALPFQVEEVEAPGTLELQVEEVFARLAIMMAQDEPLSVEGLRTIAVRLAQDVHRSEQLVAQIFAARPLSSRLVSNALNVAVLATKLGMGLRYPSEDLLEIATVALLHNVEQLMDPASRGSRPYIRRVGKKPTLRSRTKFEGHLVKQLSEYPGIAEVVGQVQERWNGQGAPNGLKGAAIHEYAQIIGLADRFETMINEEGLTAHEAMRRLLTKEKMGFRGSLLKTLVEQISLFPVGTVVRLNTGEVGTVEQTNPAHPLRPIVRIASSDQCAAHEVVSLKDLSQDMLVKITEIVNNTNERR